MTGKGETYSVSKFRVLLVKMLADVVRSSLGGSERYNFGKLVNKGLVNNVSQVQENIVVNIEIFIASAIVGRYLLAAFRQAILN